MRTDRADTAYIDAAHRVHVRVEDGVRTGKDCGIGRFPSQAMAMNKAWFAAALIAATLLTWLRLLALDGPLARAEPKTLRYKILHAAARLTRSARQRQLKILALGSRDHHRLEPDQRPRQTAPDQQPRPIPTTTPAQGPWNPGHPARQPGQCHDLVLN